MLQVRLSTQLAAFTEFRRGLVFRRQVLHLVPRLPDHGLAVFVDRGMWIEEGAYYCSFRPARSQPVW